MFPSPTGVTYYEFVKANANHNYCINEFPSPTGVTYYESYCFSISDTALSSCFRPQQGLPIMNYNHEYDKVLINCFRPQQGLPIMNQ